MFEDLPNNWTQQLDKQVIHQLDQKLSPFLDKAYHEKTIYPPKDQVFQAFIDTSYQDVKVCILGQDPYHGPGQAHGLAFSVGQGTALPPSLKNIFKELADDTGQPLRQNGNLQDWSKQGVFLLNTVLTVEKGKANSHQKLGWEDFTDHVISALNKREEPVIFLLWGNPSIKKAKLINQYKHVILQSPHPSPLAAYRGFFGSKPFTKINQELIRLGREPIRWS